MQHIAGRARHFLLAALICTLCACGGGDDESAPETGGQSSPPPAGGPPPAANIAPRISGQPSATVLSGQTYSFRPSASDEDGDSLTFSASGLPDWASIDSATGRITGAPSASDVGEYEGITITVSDGKASASLGPFSITVSDVASGTATLSWIPPTENTDGSVLGNLAGYQVRYGRDRNDLSNVISLEDPSLSVYVIENLTSGTWYFAVAAVNGAGVTSDLSNVASKTIG